MVINMTAINRCINCEKSCPVEAGWHYRNKSQIQVHLYFDGDLKCCVSQVGCPFCGCTKPVR